MNIEHLIIMANQIGDFFGANPDKDLAQQEIVEHLKKFWAKQMREQLQMHINKHVDTGLHPVVESAIKNYSQLYM